jgi:hypothetical protein
MARPSKKGGKTGAAKERKASSAKDRNPAKPKRRLERTTIRLKRPGVAAGGNRRNIEGHREFAARLASPYSTPSSTAQCISAEQSRAPC